MMGPTPALTAAEDHKRHRGHEILEDFAGLLQIPNVTGSDEDLRVNAREIKARFEARGATMEVVEIDDASPVVVGELRCENPTATLGVYVHFDGQPVDPDNWNVPPFSATLASRALHDGGEPIEFPSAGDPIDPEWRLYARGASDDKAPFAAILGALDAVEGFERTIDLVFLFEGEEESGSPNLDRYMRQLAGQLQTDAWLLCDGPVHQTGAAQVAFGCRGYSGFDLTFYGPERELHSGHYGNWVPNPAFELATFLAGCKDDSGRVLIDGFYDDTWPISASDRAALDALPPVEDLLLEELGFGGAEADTGSYAERLMYPSFNVRGLRAAAVAKDARNVIPSHATASVDMRLAAGDDPVRMLDRVEQCLISLGYVVLDREPTAGERRRHRRLAKMERAVGYRAGRIPMESPLAETLRSVCAVAAGGDVIALPTFGGSIPLYLFEDILAAPVAMLPIANHDNNQHAPDENIKVANLWYGIDLWATLLTTDLSTVGGAAQALRA